MSKEFDIAKTYPKDTIGYHYNFCLLLFGKDSEATKFLESKADESPNGYDEGVVAPESQVVHLLGQMHLKGEAK